MIDLYAPITADTVLEVRHGKMKVMDGLKIRSGIDKQISAAPVHVDIMGIVGDEHDYTFHGGVDKAIHAYCASHYAAWQSEFPYAAARFRPGGFGENFVFARFNERNIYIGDVFAVVPKNAAGEHDGGEQDSGLLLQVSLPRQPCFKLNHRFAVRNFSPNTWKTSRTGWYYRVLRPGPVQAGDEVRLVQRPHPDWPLERVQEFLHRQPGAMDMVAELAAIPEFGDECKNQFRSRLARHEAQERRKKMRPANGDDDTWHSYRVVDKYRQTPRVTSFVLEVLDRDRVGDLKDDKLILPGAYVKLRLGPAGRSMVRSYSVVRGDRHQFELGIAYDPDASSSHGASRFLHDSVGVGTVVQAGSFAQGVPAAKSASHHIFVAGGVGVTAFLALVEEITSIGYSCALHYAVRSAEETAFADRLKKYGPDVVTIYDSSQGQRMDIEAILRSRTWNSHVSFCGPERMMQAALEATKTVGVSATDVHYEAFAANTAGDAFEVAVKQQTTREEEPAQQQIFKVDEEETLLEVLQREFGDAVSASCTVGNCATCKVTVRAGQVEHRGTALTDEEKAAGNCMLTCVSRGIGRIEIEI